MEGDMSAQDRVRVLTSQIAALESQIRACRLQLHQAENEISQTSPASLASTRPRSIEKDSSPVSQVNHEYSWDHEPGNRQSTSSSGDEHKWPLAANEYKRYGRQLIMPEIGIHGQLRLKEAKVLIVGVGGLGCPAAAYLAGAGVGTLGLVDGDVVEESNLHRQIAHSTTRIGMSKVDSAHEFLVSLNPNVRYERHPHHLDPKTAVALFKRYDLVLDCTDHPTSRYLISDTCVITRRPLVSASALKTDGQLIVLNNPPLPPGDPNGGPCYRCIFPTPPPPESVTSCGEGGILGPVVGVMGVLQALEAIKLLTAVSVDAPPEPVKASLLMFSTYSSTPFRSVRMRSRRLNCAACSSQASVAAESLINGSLDYTAFCGTLSPVNLLSSQNRIDALDYARRGHVEPSILIDVRDKTQFEICSLPNAVNIPWTGSAVSWLKNAAQTPILDKDDTSNRYVICRLGNDSQIAVQALIENLHTDTLVQDIKGGFAAWRHDVDPEWPDY